LASFYGIDFLSEEDKPEGFDTASERRLDSEEDTSVKIGFGITRANRTQFLLIVPPSDPTIINDAFPTLSKRLAVLWSTGRTSIRPSTMRWFLCVTLRTFTL
jgi:hypothetical protein